MWEWSYFSESFRDIEAWVRWTVFNVDLENDYVSVLKHKISLVNNEWKIYKIEENEPFSIKTFSFIKLQEFIEKIKDKNFEDLNFKLDNEYINDLSMKLLKEFDKYTNLSEIELKWLTSEQKQELYNKLLSKYQELNFVDSDTKELFNKKLEYKKALIWLASENDKKALVENTLYDFKDTISSNNVSGFEAIIPILNENTDILKTLNINFDDYLNNISIPEWLKESIDRNLNILQNIFWEDFIEKIKSIEVTNLSWLKDKAQEKIEENLNQTLDTTLTLKDKLKNFIERIFNKN